MTNQSITMIKIEHQPSEARLQELGVKTWPISIWSKEVSEFPWTYHESETCYFRLSRTCGDKLRLSPQVRESQKHH